VHRSPTPPPTSPISSFHYLPFDPFCFILAWSAGRRTVDIFSCPFSFPPQCLCAVLGNFLIYGGFRVFSLLFSAQVYDQRFATFCGMILFLILSCPREYTIFQCGPPVEPSPLQEEMVVPSLPSPISGAPLHQGSMTERLRILLCLRGTSGIDRQSDPQDKITRDHRKMYASQLDTDLRQRAFHYLDCVRSRCVFAELLPIILTPIFPLQLIGYLSQFPQLP